MYLEQHEGEWVHDFWHLFNLHTWRIVMFVVLNMFWSSNALVLNCGSNTCSFSRSFCSLELYELFSKSLLPQSWKPSVDTSSSTVTLKRSLEPPEISCFQRIVWFGSLCLCRTLDLQDVCVSHILPSSRPLHGPMSPSSPPQETRAKRTRSFNTSARNLPHKPLWASGSRVPLTQKLH